MPAIILTPSQRKEHRADAHHIDPVVAIGGDGLTDAVVKEADLALKAHGLIKVRVFSDERETREAFFAQLAEQLNAAPIQHIGKLLVLWRPIPPKEMGIILGVAVLLDAALVRLLLLPVLIRLTGKWAWWLPAWADRILPNIKFGH